MSPALFILLFVSYLMGAIPFGYLLTKKSTGLNILEHGSGNIGSTNVGRIAGRKVAIQVQLLDMLKGLLPVALVLLSKRYQLMEMPDNFILVVAFLTILGHNFSIFLRLKGGKGVNTTLGATMLIAPLEVLLAVLTYFVVKKLFGYVSLGSIALAITLPLSSLLWNQELTISIYLLLVCLLLLVCHQSNIKRLLQGDELI